MEFFNPNMNVNFLKLSRWAALFSIILFVASLTSLMVYKLNFGLDFTGGMQVQLLFSRTADFSKIRSELKTSGFEDAQVQSYGSSRDVLVTVPTSELKAKTGEKQKETQERVQSEIVKALPGATVQATSFIGAKVSSELAYKGLLAVLVAIIVTMLYIAFRFELKLAIGAVVALIHDPVLILGVFSFFHIQFDLIGLAAILTIIGYSLNDTVVVFDRVRENFRKIRRGTPSEIVNSSVNQTLSRTVMSSGLTLMVVIALFFLGGAEIHPFALALIIGIVIGTYSSIYVAGALAVKLGLKRSDLLPAVKREFDDNP